MSEVAGWVGIGGGVELAEYRPLETIIHGLFSRNRFSFLLWKQVVQVRLRVEGGWVGWWK